MEMAELAGSCSRQAFNQLVDRYSHSQYRKCIKKTPPLSDGVRYGTCLLRKLTSRRAVQSSTSTERRNSMATNGGSELEEIVGDRATFPQFMQNKNRSGNKRL